MEGSMQANQSMLSDIERMPEAPRKRGSFHRRARSDTFFAGDGLDDLLLFDPSDMDFSSFDLFSAATTPPPPPSQQFSPMAVDSPSGESSSNGPPLHPPPRDLPTAAFQSGRHLRSLSVDSDFFDELGPADDQFAGKPLASAVAATGEKRVHHHRSSSMDGATSTTLFNVESISAAIGDKEGGKKTMGMATDKLAELALIDPKRAKRILANRQSAARSKERKTRYTNELERKVQTLQNEATTLSAKVTMLQRGTTDLTTENSQLKLQLQALEQQAQLRDALSDVLREELKRLKIAAREIPPVNGNSCNRAQMPHFSNQQQQTAHQPGTYRVQQLVTNSSSSGNNGQPPNPSYTDFSGRV